MSNTLVAIFNITVLIILGVILVICLRIKKSGRGTKDHMSDLQMAFEAQDKLIYHTSQSLLVLSFLFRNISDSFGSVLHADDKYSQDISRAIKEVAYRISDQVTAEASNYNYSLLVGECFSDTENCLLVLDKIFKECTSKEVHNIVQNFKFQLRSTAQT